MTLLRVERDGPLLRLTLARPEKRNALSIELRERLADALAAVEGEPAVAAVVIASEGSAFCAGMDRSQFGSDRAHKERLFESSRRLFQTLAAVPRPVLAAVQGPALGGGFVLAALCDVRVAGPGARFACPEISLGIPPSYGALRRVLPDPVAREVAFRGRSIDAEEALALHLVAEVAADPVSRAVAIAREMAAHGVAVLEATKRTMISGEESGVRAALAAELEAFRRALLG